MKKANPFLHGVSLRGKNAPPAPPAAAAKPKGKIGMKLKAGRHGHGVVKHVEHGQRYGSSDTQHATVTVRHGSPKKKSDKGEPFEHERTSTVHMNSADAKQLNIGDRVRVHVTKC